MVYELSAYGRRTAFASQGTVLKISGLPVALQRKQYRFIQKNNV
jgi:hypothetical protein